MFHTVLVYPLGNILFPFDNIFEKENCIMLDFETVDKTSTWGSFLERIRHFPRELIIEELIMIDALIDSDIADDSLISDYVLSYYFALCLECIRRFTDFKVGA